MRDEIIICKECKKPISIHASMKEATTMSLCVTFFVSFQSMPPRRRRHGEEGMETDVWDFNPRLHEGGDKNCMEHIVSYIDFNPRLQEGGDINWYPTVITLSWFQSTPPKRRRLFPESFYRQQNMISIHASKKEATEIHQRGRRSKKFQSTPPRRRRPGDKRSRGKQWNFNPRLREGGDSYTADFRYTDKISIHASEKEATSRE